jgi:hypothetical protein
MIEKRESKNISDFISVYLHFNIKPGTKKCCKDKQKLSLDWTNAFIQ